MVYQIFADEVLGSGQFGVVYGGMTMTANWISFCFVDAKMYLVVFRKVAFFLLAQVRRANPENVMIFQTELKVSFKNTPNLLS